MEGTRLPRDREGRAYIDLPANESTVELVRGAPDGEHPVRLTLGDGQLTVSSLIVDRHEGFPVALLWAALIFVIVWAVAWRVR